MQSTGEAPNDYRFERVANVGNRVVEEAGLLARVFANPGRYTPEYLRWQYYANPDGDILGYDAFDARTGAIAAHYVVQPLKARLFGETLKGVLSLNTATAPDHQGRGLFVRLAKMTYELAASCGYSFVIGVANANSTPGFTRKLGFQLVTPLDAFIGLGRPLGSDDRDLDFKRIWSPEARRWRMSRPGAQYWISHGQPFARAEQPGFRACLSTTREWGTASGEGVFAPLTVSIGLRPHRTWSGLRIPVPKRLRPSPLNLIFLPLTNSLASLPASRVAFEAIDFDAY